MKQNLLYKPSLFITGVLLVIISFAFTACRKQKTALATIDANAEIDTARPGGNQNTLPTISLRVTINDSEGNRITSEGKGDYINGVDYVQAILDQSGTFAFNTFAPPQKIKNAPVKRWVVYNFNDPVDSGNDYRPSPDN